MNVCTAVFRMCLCFYYMLNAYMTTLFTTTEPTNDTQIVANQGAIKQYIKPNVCVQVVVFCCFCNSSVICEFIAANVLKRIKIFS